MNEMYRLRFRTATRTKDETNRELAVRLTDLLAKWLSGCSTVEEMAEVIGLEQLLNMLPREKKVWVRERKPETGLRAGELADEYEHIRRQNPDLEEQKRRITDEITPRASLEKGLTPRASLGKGQTPRASLGKGLTPRTSLGKRLTPSGKLGKGLSPGVSLPTNYLSQGERRPD